MTKEITKARILQEIQDKFKMRELEPEIFSFSERVVPTYNIRQHLEEWISEYAAVSITSGPAGFEIFEVPNNEKWYLSAYNILFMASGAYKVTGVYIHRAGGAFLYLDMLLGQTVSYAVNLPKPVHLNPGDKIEVYIDDYTSTADLRLVIDYIKEEIR